MDTTTTTNLTCARPTCAAPIFKNSQGTWTHQGYGNIYVPCHGAVLSPGPLEVVKARAEHPNGSNVDYWTYMVAIGEA